MSEKGRSPVAPDIKKLLLFVFFIILTFSKKMLVFLIFDLEILLVFPASLALYEIGPFGFTIMTVFFSLLTIGFVLEIGSGAISLSNYDNFNNKNKD